MENLDSFNEMMFHFYLSNSSNSADKHFQEAIKILKSDKINIYAQDKQLLREIKCGRFTPEHTQIINQIIQEKINSAVASPISFSKRET